MAPAPQPVVGGPAGARPKFAHCADYLCQLAMLNHLLLEARQMDCSRAGVAKRFST